MLFFNAQATTYIVFKYETFFEIGLNGKTHFCAGRQQNVSAVQDTDRPSDWA